MPKEGISRREYRTKKFGSWERSQELDAKMVAVGETEGIHFAFDRNERTPNTLDAHRLIWLADKHGVQDAVVEALFRAYFTEGRDISNRQTLIDVVAEAGLDRDQAEGVLNSDEGMGAISVAHEQSRRIGVEGVPFFIVNEKVTLSGAQPPEAFLEATHSNMVAKPADQTSLTAITIYAIIAVWDESRIHVSRTCGHNPVMYANSWPSECRTIPGTSIGDSDGR
jgi:predicted DsbA family dithiol-disulfide isomerase